MAIDIGLNRKRDQNTLKKYPKLSLLKKNPIAKAVTDKLFTNEGRQGGHSGGYSKQNRPPSASYAQTVSDNTTDNINDINNIRQLLPDTELAKQILISSILSPNDMVTVDLGFRIDNDYVESEISGLILDYLKTYFEKTYKIHNLLPTILEESLFDKGSYPMLILPENAIDDVIHNDQRVTLESLRGELSADGRPKRSIGLLGSSTKSTNKWSMESLFSSPQTLSEAECRLNPSTLTKQHQNFYVTDNINVLKFPKVVERMRRERVQDVLSSNNIGLEARRSTKKPFTEKDVVDSLYTKKEYESTPYISLKSPSNLANKNRGNPLVMRLPSEAVIPVHVPSNPEDHIGYFVLLDQYGNPLERVKETSYYRDLTRNMQSKNITSQLLQAGRRATEGYDQKDATNNDEMIRIYASVVENDLLQRLKNGVYGGDIEISRPMDVYRIMLSRALASMGTQILYIPRDMVVYFAFDYNQYGVGKSLLEDNKILAGMRAMLLFSNTMASIKNSTGRTGLKIDLDPEDPDPGSTVEYMIHEYARNRQSSYPLGASNPLDIIDFLQNAGVDVQVSGNAAYPETRLEVEDHSSNKVQIDRDLDDEIKRKYFMSLGLSPETVDSSSEVEFATSVVTSNLLLAKRVMVYQDTFVPMLKEFIEKYVLNSAELQEGIHEIIKGNKKHLGEKTKSLEPEEIIETILEGLELYLPRPDTAKLENQLESFRLYTDALEQAVDAYFGEDSFMLRDFDDVEENIRGLRAAVIAYFKRQWLRNNNVLPELMDLANIDEDGMPELDLLEIHGNHLEMIGKSVTALIEKMRKDREEREKRLEGGEEKDDTGDTGDSDPGNSFFGDQATPQEEPEEEEPEEEETPIEDDTGEGEIEEEEEPESDGEEENGEEDDTPPAT